jgi:hypothetical protein
MSLRRELIEAVLDNLETRRPFKYDLPRFRDEAPDIWGEMIGEIEAEMSKILKSHGVEVSDA